MTTSAFNRRHFLLAAGAAALTTPAWVHAQSGAWPSRGPIKLAVQYPPGALPGLAAVERLNCKQAASALRTDLLIGRRGERTFAATGLSAYSKALELGIASLASDEVVPGTVEIPLTSATDDLAFARQQAEAISADQALIEAYRRSNAGNFAEAAEFFAVSSAALAGPDSAEGVWYLEDIFISLTSRK